MIKKYVWYSSVNFGLFPSFCTVSFYLIYNNFSGLAENFKRTKKKKEPRVSKGGQLFQRP